jgi:hypothetical protein
MRLYADGILAGSLQRNNPPLPNQLNLRLGGTASAGENPANATIDEVAIYDRALAPQEILAKNRLPTGRYSWRAEASDGALTNSTEGAFNVAYQVGPSGGFSLIPPTVRLDYPANYSGFSTPPVTLNLTIADAENNTLDVWVYAGNSSDAGGRLVYENMSLANNATITLTVDSLPLAAGYDGGIVLLYHLDNDSRDGENTTRIVDHSGRGNHATAINGTLPSYGGKFAGAYVFDGTDDCLEAQPAAALDQNSAVTVSAWIRRTANKAGAEAIILKGSGAAANYKLMLNAGTKRLAFWTGGAIQESAMTLPLGGWHHIAAVTNSTATAFYLDGLYNSSTTVGIGASNGQPLWVGGHMYGDEYLAASMDELAIWDRALNPAEIRAIAGLSNGTYWWRANVSDGTYSNTSATRTFTIGMAAGNRPPTFGYRLLQPAEGEAADTYIENGSASNYGAERSLLSGRNQDRYYRSLLYFNVTSIPASANITRASMGLYLYNSSYSTTDTAHNATSQWDPRYAAWYRRTQTLDWLTPGGDYA